MRNFPQQGTFISEGLNTNINQRIPLVSAYLFLILILKEVFHLPFPDPIFWIISFMLLSPLAVIFFADQLSFTDKTILKVFFIYVAGDALLLTIIIYYLGGITWIGFIFYSFYLVLNFLTFSRKLAFFLTAWILFLYLDLVLLQYFRILPFSSLFLPQQQTPFYLPYVLTTTIGYLSTITFVAYYSGGFYQVYARKIFDIRTAQEILEKEKLSLEERVETRKKELEEEKRGLQERIREKRKELAKEEQILRGRVEELKKFQQIALGREEKLKELSQELKRLQQE